MKNNKKTILLILITITTLILLSTASATTDTNTTTTTSTIKEKTTTTEPVVKEKIQNTQIKEKRGKTQDKTINKTDKTEKSTKTSTKTIEVTDGEELYLAVSSLTSETYDEGIIELKEGTYDYTGKGFLPNAGNTKKITINGNYQTITGVQAINTNGGYKLILNNLITNVGNFDNRGGEFSINNCTINISNRFGLSGGGTTIIDDDSQINVNGQIRYMQGTIYTNDTTLISKLKEAGCPDENINPGGEESKNKIIENQNISNQQLISETSNYTYINCQINAKITNNGNITLVNCSFSNNNLTSSGNNCLLDNKGNASLVNCIFENNTLNRTISSSYTMPVYAILNDNGAVLSLNNTLFKNNTGRGILISNDGVISNWRNTSFIGNSLPGYTGQGTLIVTDSLFENNTNKVFDVTNMSVFNSEFNNNKIFQNDTGIAGGTGPTGIVIFAGNLLVDNCTFDGNGYISKDSFMSTHGVAILATNLTVNNSVFKNNILNTTSTWGGGLTSSGAAIYVNTRDTSYDSSCEVYNSYFENNYVYNPGITEFPTVGRPEGTLNAGTQGYIRGSGADIFARGTLIAKNNTFVNSYAKNQAGSIYAYSQSSSLRQNNITIVDNIFSQCESSMDTIVIEYNDTYGSVDILVENNSFANTTVNDELIINIPNKIYAGEEVIITGSYKIFNTSYYGSDIYEQNKFNVYINGVLNQTLDTLEFSITPAPGNTIITVQPTISQTRKTTSIKSTTLSNVTITPENYNQYIFEGQLLGIDENTKITFNGVFDNKDEILIDINNIIINGKDANFTNTLFILEGNDITLQNMNIKNTNTGYPITNTGDNNTITNNTISITNTEGKTATIYNKANNTTISYNTLTVDGPAYSTDFSQGLGLANTQAILLTGGDANIIEYNNITVTCTGSSSNFGTVEAITNSLKASNTQIRSNNITVKGNAKFNYGITSLGDVKNMTIEENNLLITGERYTAGIQVGDGAENILIQKNNIKCVCHNTTPVDEEAITYGIITINSNVGYKDPDNITIQANNIDLSGSVNYGMEIYRTTNSQITENNITVTGLQSMGIGFAHSPNNYVFANNITTTGDSSVPLGRVTEEIQPKNVGIQVQQESNGVVIGFNNINTYDKAGQDTCVYTDSEQTIVGFNNLTSSTKVGNDAVNGTTTTQINNNTAIEQESTTQTTTEDLRIGESTTLTAQFYDDTYTPVSDGKAIFKVNGKTLRDNQGNVIYADVINGRAELPNVNITQEWTKEGTTIQAVYIGDDNNEPITTTPTTVTVTKPEATITLEAPTEATAGTTITLKATVTDGNTPINSGRVAFKLNGKTLKDPKTGKALYANVENGVATIQYTIPEKTKAKEYVLTAVFTDRLYDRKETNSTLNVVKA